MLLSCGEVISASLMANTIKSKGYDSVALTGFQAGIKTNSDFGNADVIKVNTDNIIKHLKANKIIVITGFQGINEDGDITTLGRGGSDTTAVILGEALNANVVEIYTDVDGIMTADPKIVPEANVIENLCYDEVYQMAKGGAKVIHPRAVEIARRSNVTLKIKNTFNDSEGTIINNQYIYTPNTIDINKIHNLITAITHKTSIIQVKIDISNNDTRNSMLLNELENRKISIDMINFFEDRKVFTTEEKHLQILKEILNSNKFDYEIITDCSKITAISHKIHGVPGVMSKLVRTLSNNNIKILQTSDSHTTISCLIENKNLEKAVKSIHKEFDLSK